MKDSRMRIVLFLCSVVLLIIPNKIFAHAELGPPFKFTFTETFIPMGTVSCVDVVVEGIEDVRAFEFGISFDTNVFSFASVQTSVLDPSEFFGFLGTNMAGEEILTIIFTDFDGTTTLPDGTIAFTVCFEALTNDGDFTTLVFTDLANGNQSQIFTDVGAFQAPDLCIVGTDVIVGNPPMDVSITTTVQGTSCQDDTDGILEIDISGGRQPYSLIVTDCNTGDVIRGPESVGNNVVVSNLGTGDYCIEVTDDSTPSLDDTAMATIVNNGPSLGVRFASIEPTCNGFSNGSIEAFAILNAVEQPNPNADFNFVWTQSGGPNNVIGPDLINIGAGTYEVQITDIASSCAITQTVILTEPTAVIVDIAVVNESCAIGGMDGEVAAVTTGGVGNYTFQWDDPSSSMDSLVTNLAPRTYTVNVRDGNGCVASDTDLVSPPQRPEILGFDSVSISCPGLMDGELEVLFIDGSAPLDRIEWNSTNGMFTGTRITDLSPGEYQVTVIGLDGCSDSATVTLGNPDGVMIDLANSTVTDEECSDDQGLLGQLNIAITGGTGPFQIFLNGDLQAGNTIPNLPAGSYDVSVIDVSGCQSGVETFIINKPPALTVDFIDITPVLCFEGPGGSATAVPMNGPTTNYIFTWESGEMDATAISLIGGEQSLLLQSGNCTIDTFVTIPQPAELMADVDIMNASCFGFNDGQINLDVTGGTGAITISSTEPVNGTSITDLPAGMYPVIISDANNCEIAISSIEIAQPDSLDAFISDIQNITCSGEADGLLAAGVNGGTGNVTFQWNTGPGDTFNTNTGLLAGDYIVSVTDENGCIDTAMATIIEPPSISAVIPPIPDAPCFGEQTVISVVQATGGNGAQYTFTINAGPAIPVGANSGVPVFAGDYTITVFDAIGCRETIEVSAVEPPPIQVSISSEPEINLGGSTLVFANVNSVFDIDSLFWTETPADSTLSCYDCLNPTASPLDDAVYQLTAIDVNGCSSSAEFRINVDSDRNVYIPNAFTPYQVDGFNDFFSPFTGVGVERVVSFEIFDRWGELVFNRENFLPGSTEIQGWDGTFRGKIASKGVYFYIARVQFIDGVILTYRGDVTVM